MRKTIVIVVFLSVIVSVVNISSVASATINVPGDYATIQAAVNNAHDGDTIVVASGTYAGATIDKNVTISGASDGSSIITSGVHYGGGHPTLETAFLLDTGSDGAAIQNFTINCDQLTDFFFAVFSRGIDNITVNSLTVNDTIQGITNWGGSGWIITNNTVIDYQPAGGGGIAIWVGVNTTHPVANGNIIENNTLTTSVPGAATFTCPAISLAFDDRSGGETGNEELFNNKILNNTITVTGGPLTNTGGVEVGIIGLGGDPNKIAALIGCVHDNTISSNIIKGAEMGVYMYTVSNLSIVKNEITNCDIGVRIDDGNSGNNINCNDIYGNASYGVFNASGSYVDARFNWWGNASGPIHADNPGGTGDTVSDFVKFAPWGLVPNPCAPRVTPDQPKTYGKQTCTLARNNISKAETLMETVEDRLTDAQELDVDTTEVEELLFEAQKLLEEAKTFCQNSQNCIAGNTLALEAQELIEEAEKLLNSLLS
ncbi:MAG: NosD domain-containing protein [Candidatus Methanofastidiosia archaeon]|jgi:hypothetical protein